MTESDIDPDSGCRLPLPRREALDPAAREIFDRHLDPEGGSLAGLKGPGGIRLHSPELSRRLRPVGHYLRFETGLAPRLRELAILVTARETDSRFEWAAHEAEALKEGLSREAVEIVKRRRPVEGLAEEEAAIIALGREAIGAHRVSSETYAEAHRLFGTKGLVDLVSLMGNYMATAALLCVFDARPEPGKPELPIP